METMGTTVIKEILAVTVTRVHDPGLRHRQITTPGQVSTKAEAISKHQKNYTVKANIMCLPPTHAGESKS